MGINIFQIDTFSKVPFGGTPTGVIPDCRRLKEEYMSLVARELNVDETAFIKQVDDDYFKVRFFSRNKEIDICGHSTIGAFYMLANRHYISPIENGIKVVNEETKLGVFPVYLNYKNSEIDKVYIKIQDIESLKNIARDEVLSAGLNIDPEKIGNKPKDLKIEIIRADIEDILIPIKTRQDLRELKLDPGVLMNLCKKYKTHGIHFYNLDDLDDNKVYTRYFMCVGESKERPAIVSANAALIYLLKKNNLLYSDSIVVNQGEEIGRPSELFISIDENNEVRIGGQSRMAFDGILRTT